MTRNPVHVTRLEVAKVCGVHYNQISFTLKEWREKGLIPNVKHLDGKKNREKFISKFITGDY